MEKVKGHWPLCTHTYTHNLTKSSANHSNFFCSLRAVQVPFPLQKTTPCFIFCCSYDLYLHICSPFMCQCISRMGFLSDVILMPERPNISSLCALRRFPRGSEWGLAILTLSPLGPIFWDFDRIGQSAE